MILSMMDLILKASPGTVGHRNFFEYLFTDPPQGAPSGAAEIIIKMEG